MVCGLLAREPRARPSASEALADDWFAAMGVAEQGEAARQLALLVEEQQRFREEEAALAGAAQAQFKELQRLRETMEGQAASFSQHKLQQEERLRKQRHDLQARAQALAGHSLPPTTSISCSSPCHLLSLCLLSRCLCL